VEACLKASGPGTEGRELLADIEAGLIELDGSIAVTDWCKT